MYITKVLSYNNAWGRLLNEYPALSDDLRGAIGEVNITNEDILNDKGEYQYSSAIQSLMSVSRQLDIFLSNREWSENDAVDSIDTLSKSMGISKGGVALRFELNNDFLANFLFKRMKLLNTLLDKQISLPIIGNFDEFFLDTFLLDRDFRIFTSFEDTVKEFKELYNPLSFDTPFLILGISHLEQDLDLIEVNVYETIKINHSITFNPEYFQAGLGVLNYFGTVLREKYPEQNATVKIEQQDLNVRMIVESGNGSKEIIERALHEYELVISGETSAEDFYPTAIQTLELKNQIRMLNFQLESQKEIIALKNGEILNLRALAHQALRQSQPNITVINQLHNEQNIKIDYKTEINQSYDAIDELIDLLSDESLKNQLRDIQNALDNTRERQTPEEVRESSGFKKLGKFLRQAKDASSNIHGILENTDNAVGVIEKLAKHYDKLVQFCQSFVS